MNPEKINYDDFAKVEIRAGKILSAEKIADTDKLLKLSVDVGEVDCSDLSNPLGKPTPRQIISGIALHFPDPTVLVGRTCMFVTNLEPRTIRGYVSDGMLFAVSTDAVFSLLEPAPGIPPGTKAR
jgi:methionyl-tRNA synthetase